MGRGNANINHPNRIDRNAIHRLLSRRTDHFGRYKMDLKSLAAETGINYYNLSTIITGMAREGRLRKVGGTQQGPKTYLVTPPDDWKMTGAGMGGSRHRGL